MVQNRSIIEKRMLASVLNCLLDTAAACAFKEQDINTGRCDGQIHTLLEVTRLLKRLIDKKRASASFGSTEQNSYGSTASSVFVFSAGSNCQPSDNVSHSREQAKSESAARNHVSWRGLLPCNQYFGGVVQS